MNADSRRLLGRRIVTVTVTIASALVGHACGWAQQAWQPPPVMAPAMPGAQMTQMVAGTGGAYHQMSISGQRIQITGPVDQRGRLTYSRRSGIQLSVDVSAVSQFGYQPVVITASVKKAAKSDRQIRVTFNAGGWYNRGKSITVEQTFTLPAGDTSASVTLLAPQYQDWQLCGWKTVVDRMADDELTVADVGIPQQSTSFAMSALIASPGNAQWEAEMQSAFQVLGNGTCTVRTHRLADLPEDWVHYSTFDVVALAVDDYRQLAARHPKKHAALLRWIRAGGNLFLLGAGTQWQNLPAVERALGLRTSATDGRSAGTGEGSDDAIVARGWRFVPLGERAAEPLEGALELSGFDLGDAARPTAPASPESDATAQSAQTLRAAVETSRAKFAVRPLGLGTVTVFRQASWGMVNSAPIIEIQRSLLMPRLSSIGRYGNKPDEPNAEFNNLLIPGVGVAPVGQFQFLITLFVLAIGPLNYWWLKRQKRLPLLLATVPAAATVVTLLLLFYGVFADGLGVRLRARSLTVLDQRTNESATWARLSYYAGINPRRGLNVPSDTVLYPVLTDWAMGSFYRGPLAERQMTWSDEQRLRRGWLASRTPTQYLAINARPSTKKLDLRRRGEKLEIFNRLEATVRHLVVQDHSGNMYWCDQLAPGEGRSVPVAARNAVASRMRKLFSDNYPEFPMGSEPVAYGRNYYGVLLSQNVAESQLEAINSPIVQNWGNGGYIAITDRGVEVDLGIDDVAEEASFHVIRGFW